MAASPGSVSSDAVKTSSSTWSGTAGELDSEPCAEKIEQSLTHFSKFFSVEQCDAIEAWVDHTAWQGSMGMFHGPKTLDATPCRHKYFFGKGYTYGRGMRGKEQLLPEGEVDPIPDWMRSLVVAPLEHAGIVKPGWVDSVVMNDYRAGSSIVGHVDPVSLFARPIVTVTMFCPAKLVFGASFDPERRTPPAYSQLLERGSVLLLDGYAANAVTHGIRPEDILGPRRVSLVLRHVIQHQPDAEAATLDSPLVPMMPFIPAVIPVPMPAFSPVLIPWMTQQAALGLSLSLMLQVQGHWYTNLAGSSSKRTVHVQGLQVVMVPPSKLGKSKKSAARKRGEQLAQSEVPTHSALRLLPTEFGLLCHDLLLEAGGVQPKSLTWRSLGKPETWHDGLGAAALNASSTVTWIRLEN
eukprot:TRINITY_DN22561_c0_g1_i1.p1 TRINITY_DN22561_c0_g1~~TRINITY_DN22561_c0_g1_i1.p1  ORF type:complete len:409 (-),score=56.60 TRINITY_DN22561_c0_g1_i1:15-1241(-)